MADAVKESSKVSKGYLVFLVILMGLVSQMDSWLSLIEIKAIPRILIHFALSPSEFAFLQGIFGIIVFGVFFIGWFADAAGRKAGIMTLVLVMGIPTILIVFFSNNIYIFLLLYSLIIMGTTSNLWEVPISEEAPAKQRGILGGIAFFVGMVPLYALIGSGIVDRYGWQWGYGVMFFLMVILVGLILFMRNPRRWETAARARGGKRLGVITAIRKIRKEDGKYIAIATIVYLAWTICFKMAATFGGYYFSKILSYTDEQLNSILTVAGLLLPASVFISGFLLDKLGRNFVLITGSAGASACLILLGLTRIPAFYQAQYFFMAMILSWVVVYLAEIFPNEVRGTSIGVCITGARLGYVLGPFLASFLTAKFPGMGGFWIVCGILMAVPLLTLFAKPLETKGKTLEEIETAR